MNIHRVATTQQLREIAAAGLANGYNRVLDVPENVNPTGAHVLTIVIFDHNGDRNDDDVDMHHRCQLMLGLKDTMEPMYTFIDISERDFSSLPTVEQIKASLI